MRIKHLGLLYAFAVLFVLLSITVSAQCADSDAGKDYAVKGTVQAGLFTRNDFCLSGRMLIENYCDASGNAKYERHSCKCEKGACTSSFENTAFELPEGVTCAESDNGQDYTTKGFAYEHTETTEKRVTDYCISSRQLVEVYCNADGKLTAERVPCACKSGACVGAQTGAAEPYIIVTFYEDPQIRTSAFASQFLFGEPKVTTKYDSVNELNKQYDVQKALRVDENKFRFYFKQGTDLASAREDFGQSSPILASDIGYNTCSEHQTDVLGCNQDTGLGCFYHPVAGCVSNKVNGGKGLECSTGSGNFCYGTEFCIKGSCISYAGHPKMCPGGTECEGIDRGESCGNGKTCTFDCLCQIDFSAHPIRCPVTTGDCAGIDRFESCSTGKVCDISCSCVTKTSPGTTCSTGVCQGKTPGASCTSSTGTSSTCTTSCDCPVDSPQSPSPPASPSPSPTAPRCGNGVLDSGEACDTKLDFGSVLNKPGMGAGHYCNNYPNSYSAKKCLKDCSGYVDFCYGACKNWDKGGEFKTQIENGVCYRILPGQKCNDAGECLPAGSTCTTQCILGPSADCGLTSGGACCPGDVCRKAGLTCNSATKTCIASTGVCPDCSCSSNLPNGCSCANSPQCVSQYCGTNYKCGAPPATACAGEGQVKGTKNCCAGTGACTDGTCKASCLTACAKEGEPIGSSSCCAGTMPCADGVCRAVCSTVCAGEGQTKGSLQCCAGKGECTSGTNVGKCMTSCYNACANEGETRGSKPCCSGLSYCADGTCKLNCGYAECTKDSDCISPPTTCHKPVGLCATLSGGTCVYQVSYNNRPDGCACTGSAQCSSGYCNGACGPAPSGSPSPTPTPSPSGPCGRAAGSRCCGGNMCYGNLRCNTAANVCETPADTCNYKGKPCCAGNTCIDGWWCNPATQLCAAASSNPTPACGASTTPCGEGKICGTNADCASANCRIGYSYERAVCCPAGTKWCGSYCGSCTPGPAAPPTPSPAATCGNGIPEAGEECDWDPRYRGGNANPGSCGMDPSQYCDSTCKIVDLNPSGVYKASFLCDQMENCAVGVCEAGRWGVWDYYMSGTDGSCQKEWVNLGTC